MSLVEFPKLLNMMSLTLFDFKIFNVFIWALGKYDKKVSMIKYGQDPKRELAILQIRHMPVESCMTFAARSNTPSLAGAHSAIIPVEKISFRVLRRLHNNFESN